jgi:hypothetical protein
MVSNTVEIICFIFCLNDECKDADHPFLKTLNKFNKCGLTVYFRLAIFFLSYSKTRG